MTVPADALRIFVYDSVVQHGLPPTSAQIGERFGVQPGAARDAIASLKIGKTVLAHPRTGEIWMAGPFSAAPTPYRAVGRKTESRDERWRPRTIAESQAVLESVGLTGAFWQLSG